jgi:hypothetical protein
MSTIKVTQEELERSTKIENAAGTLSLRIAALHDIAGRIIDQADDDLPEWLAVEILTDSIKEAANALYEIALDQARAEVPKEAAAS